MLSVIAESSLPTYFDGSSSHTQSGSSTTDLAMTDSFLIRSLSIGESQSALSELFSTTLASVMDTFGDIKQH
jgi:hypothetical protein